MCFISLNKGKKAGHFLMYCLSVYLIKIQSYPVFSNMALDHWCLSLRVRCAVYDQFVPIFNGILCIVNIFLAIRKILSSI